MTRKEEVIRLINKFDNHISGIRLKNSIVLKNMHILIYETRTYHFCDRDHIYDCFMRNARTLNNYYVYMKLSDKKFDEHERLKLKVMITE